MSDVENDSELNPSDLGTISYWNSFYKVECQNFEEFGDEGEVWFGKAVSQKIVAYASQKYNNTLPLIDIGCGNGQLSISLARAGFTDVTGIDYSESAIALAKSIAEGKKCIVQFKVADVLQLTEDFMKKFFIAFDKGTYDAISLSPEDALTKRQTYIEVVYNLLTDDGIFILTSCNWTLDEIKTQFQDYFTCEDVIPNTTFTFGGKKGQNVTSVVLKKR